MTLRHVAQQVQIDPLVHGTPEPDDRAWKVRELGGDLRFRQSRPGEMLAVHAVRHEVRPWIEGALGLVERLRGDEDDIALGDELRFHVLHRFPVEEAECGPIVHTVIDDPLWLQLTNDRCRRRQNDPHLKLVHSESAGLGPHIATDQPRIDAPHPAQVMKGDDERRHRMHVRIDRGGAGEILPNLRDDA